MQEMARADMTFEERCRQADKRRLAGNELFKAGEIDEADSKYTIVRAPLTAPGKTCVVSPLTLSLPGPGPPLRIRLRRMSGDWARR